MNQFGFVAKCAAGIALTVTAALSSANAQEVFPSRALTIVTPFTPGSVTDILARTIGNEITQRLGQPVIVDNRTGGGGAVGMNLVAKARPDGYTYGITISSTVTQLPHINKDLPYDTLKDLQPVAALGILPLTFDVAANSPYKNWLELIAAAKDKPGTLNVGIFAPVNSIGLAMIQNATGAKFTEIPFPGQAPAHTALLGGHVDVVFSSPASSRALMDGGKVRTLAATTLKRAALQPDVPTIAEMNISGYDLKIWYGVMTTAGVPKDRLDKVSQEITRAAALPNTREIFTKAALEPAAMSPEQFVATVKSEYESQGEIIRKYGIK